MISLDTERKSFVIFQRENIRLALYSLQPHSRTETNRSNIYKIEKENVSQTVCIPPNCPSNTVYKQTIWPQNNKQLQKDCFLETVLDETSREKAAFQDYLSKDFLSIPARNIDCFMQICLICVEFLEYFRFLFF